MARRPPLIVLADGGSPDELVKVRILLDSTLAGDPRPDRATFRPSSRTGGVSSKRCSRRAARWSEAKKPDRQAPGICGARAASAGARLRRRQPGAGRRRCCARRRRTSRTAARRPQSARRSARRWPRAALARTGAAPSVAGRGRGDPIRLSPTSFRPRQSVTDGLGQSTASGMSSRGLTLATGRGASSRPRRTGSSAFQGPFRDYDGVLIIDHGGGWISLIVNVSSTLAARATKSGSAIRSAGRLARCWSNCLKMGVESLLLSSQVHLKPCQKRQRRLNACAAPH